MDLTTQEQRTDATIKRAEQGASLMRPWTADAPLKEGEERKVFPTDRVKLRSLYKQAMELESQGALADSVYDIYATAMNPSFEDRMNMTPAEADCLAENEKLAFGLRQARQANTRQTVESKVINERIKTQKQEALAEKERSKMTAKEELEHLNKVEMETNQLTA